MSSSAKNDEVCHNKQKSACGYLESQDQILLQPFTYITEIDTRDTWRQLAKAFNYWLKVPDETFAVIDECYRKFYYADLLFDDMQNNATSRGNKPCAHIVYDPACTINAAFLVQLLAAATLNNLDHPQAPKLYIEQTNDTCIARWMELYWRDTVICPTEDEYYQMIIKKTSGLLTTQIKHMQLFSTNQDNFTRLSVILGLYFHILEDYQQFKSDDETKQETSCEELTLGRFSLPIIHAAGEDQRIIHILRQRTQNPLLKKYAVELLEETGSLEYTKRKLIELRAEALREIEKLGRNPLMDSFIENYLNTVDSVVNLDNKVENNDISAYITQLENIQLQDNSKDDIVSKAKQELLQPYKHGWSDARSKIIRMLMRMVNKASVISRKRFAKLMELLFYFLYAVLILDDIQDYSDVRHGIPSAHLIYGVANTLNAVLYCINISLGSLLELNHPQALNVYYKELLSFFRGQGLDLHWRENFICPTEEEYMNMIDGKASGLLRIMGKTLHSFATTNKHKDIEKLTSTAGKFIQIHNDYGNLKDQYNFEDAKTFCEDITEGKFSFPVIHAINTHPEEGKLILDILRQRTNDIELKKYFISLIQKCGSIEYTKEKLIELKAAVLKEMKGPHNEEREIIENMLNKKFPL